VLPAALAVLARFDPAAAARPAAWGVWLAGLAAGLLLLVAPAGPRAALRRPALPAALAGLALVAGWIMWPYCSPWLVGGGDARDYALHIADAVTQFRAGVMPVLVGQSDFAFNGDIHPLRTAPGLFYAAGLLDLLTVHALSGPALQNLLIVLNGLAAAYTAYRSLLRLAPARAWTAWMLAAFFITSPGILSGLYAGDMIATWMTLPWLPPFFLQLQRMADHPDRLEGPVRGAALLAGLWLMHAAIAFWASVCALPFAFWHAIQRWRATRQVLPLFGVVGVFGLLSAYVFASALTLRLPEDPNLRAAVEGGAIAASLQYTWKGFLRPVSDAALSLLTDLQPSPALWLSLLVGILGVRWSRDPSPRLLILVIGGLLALLLPSSTSVWRLLPDLVLSTTEKWPAQRFLPILSAAIPFLALQAFAAMRPDHRRLTRDLTLLLIVAGAWSLAETRKYHQRGRAVNHGPVATAQRFHPGNIQLSRYSHEYYGPLPRYFSHGPMEPQSQLRLLDPATLEQAASNETHLLASVPPAGPAVAFRTTDYGGILPDRIDLPAGGRVLFAFSFPVPAPEGVLQFTGRSLSAEYAIPESGEAFAFGVSRTHRPHLTLWNSSAAPEQIEVKFIRRPGGPSGIGQVAVTVIPYPSTGLPLELRGLIPLEVTARTAAAAWLETPRLFVPGYRARVDGRTVATARSPDGLVMVPVPAGDSRVTVDYPGPFGLRLVFGVSAAAWLAFAGLSWPGLRRPRWPDLASPVLLARLGRGTIGAAALGLVAVAAHSALAPRRPGPVAVPAAGRTEQVVRLPVGRPAGATEPLLSVSTDRGSVQLLAQYVDGKHVRLGYQREDGVTKFGDPVYTNYLADQRIEIREGEDGADLAVFLDHRAALRIPAAPPPR